MGCSSSKEEVVVKTEETKKSSPTSTQAEEEKKVEEEKKEEESPKKKTPKTPNPNISSSHTLTADDKNQSQLSGTAVLGDLTLRYGCVSQHGRDVDDKCKPNQDSFSLLKEDGYLFWGVYDGHGPQGAPCSQFVAQQLPELIQQNLQMLSNNRQSKRQDDAPAVAPSQAEIQYALQQAHIECNQDLRAREDIDDSYSGTTSISILMQTNGKITISNVGDSRALLGTQQQPSSLMALPLSQDQTPHRPEEAQRCIKNGARILSFGQINPSPEGEDEDEEDPPRVWSKKGKFPGTAFTRSIGDAVAQTLGVFAEPEVMTLTLSPKEKVLVCASDGIYDVLENQQVMDIIVANRHDPIQACKAVLEKSHQEWLFNEDNPPEEEANYDDMTIFCIFVGDPEKDPFWEVSQEAEACPEADPHRRKRVRQKTLRNLEEMAEETAI